ncbi:hypothetical protein CW368_11960 [Actinomycetales bacterium SN12]|nr:hypothetical protein CW368_11960 [Actinomycetales bacterium SN12]
MYIGFDPTYREAMAFARGMKMALIMAGYHTDYAATHRKLDQDGTLGGRHSPEGQAGGIRSLES